MKTDKRKYAILDDILFDNISKVEKRDMKHCQNKENIFGIIIDETTFCLYNGYLPCPYKKARSLETGAGFICQRTYEKEN